MPGRCRWFTCTHANPFFGYLFERTHTRRAAATDFQYDLRGPRFGYFGQKRIDLPKVVFFDPVQHEPVGREQTNPALLFDGM